MFIVPNGVDKRFDMDDTKVFSSKYNLSDYILTVGRIEPRKNQLNLIRAMKGISKDLVVIGEAVTGYEWYFEKCKKESGENIHFLGKIDNIKDGHLLTGAYAGADIFVLPGWFETPGLSALEAALGGCKVIATSGGSTKEYFFDKVLYIDPASVNDIRNKIRMAIKNKKTNDLKELVINNYTWEKVAEKTIEAYESICPNTGI